MKTQSNRKKAFISNPATKFLSWKSNDKCFSYYDKENATYDKENATNVKVELPFKFLVLDELHTVSGWNDASNSGIYSNEVKFISKEPMTVKPYKGNEIAKGIYKDIKEKIVAAGGHYVKSVYTMLEDGSLANIQLKGAAVRKWSEFTAKNRSRLTDEWIVVKDTLEEKKGAVKFYTPNFTFESSLSEADATQADECFNTLESYLKAYLVKAEDESITVVDPKIVEPEDDLDF